MSALGLLAIAVLSQASCRDAALPGERGPTAQSSTPASSAGATCEGQAPTCVDGATRRACGGGAWTEETCAGDTTCLGGSCAQLTDPEGAAVVRARVRSFGAEGFLDAWSVITPISKKLADGYVDSLDPSPLGGPKGWKPLCARDGYVVPRAKGVDKNDGQILSVMGGIVFSDEARKAQLRISSSGKLKVYLGSKLVADIAEARGIPKRALPDEHSISIDLPKGASHLTAVLEAPNESERFGGFFARLRRADGGPLSGVAFTERFDPCQDDALLDPRAELDVTSAGLTLSVNPTFRGLLPAKSQPFPLLVSIGSSGKTSTTIELGDTRPLVLQTPERGAFEVSVRSRANPSGDSLFTRSIPAYGTLIGRISKLAKIVKEWPAHDASPEASRDSFEHHVDTLKKLIGSGDSDVSFIERQTQIAERLADRIGRGEDPYAMETGVVYRAYRSRLDGQLQPYVAFVPKSQLKKKPQPLVLISHGRDRSPEHALRTLIGEAPDDHMTLRFAARNLPAFPDQGALLVAPYGYDEGGPHPLGEDDLLRVVDEMSAAYSVDPRKVSLTGYSLGGTVAFVAPLHHPDRFSAAAPLCGYPNLMGYSSVANVPHAAWEDALLGRKYAVNYAENGTYLPLHIVHGGLDTPGRSKVMADKYRELGYSYIFDVQDDLDHDVWDYAYEDGKMVGWLEGKTRPSSPKRVRFSGDYRYDHAYWVKLTAMRDAAGPLARIDARLDESSATLTVKTDNASGVTLDRAAMEPQATWTKACSVIIDGDKLEIGAGQGPIFLERGEKWGVVESETSRKGRKRHGVSGPLDDVQRHPVVVVYGTGNEAHIASNRMVAEHFGKGVGLGDLDYPVLSDREATGEAIAKKSLILVGNPSENLLLAGFAASLPIKFEGGAIVAKGKRYEGESVGVSFIAPRPDEPEEYVVVHAGLGDAGVLASRFLPRYLPDFVVYDERLSSERGGLLFGDRPVIAGGFFSDAWD